MPTAPPPPPPAAQSPVPFDAALVTAAGMQLLTATSAAVAVAGVYQVIKHIPVPRQALYAAFDIAISFPPGQTGAYGPATLAMERTNLRRRAQFVVSASRRIGQALAAASSNGTPLAAALETAVTRERRFYAQHLIAIWNRSQAGAQTDSAAMTYGLLLGWHTVRDAKTSADCLAADGKNFYADHMPLIGYPGAVHPHCRCQPGAPFPGARLVPSYGLVPAQRYRRAA